MIDIVERLKGVTTQRAICHEAATEIELLRAVVRQCKAAFISRDVAYPGVIDEVLGAADQPSGASRLGGYGFFGRALEMLADKPADQPPAVQANEARDAARWRHFERHAHIANDNPRNWALVVSNRRMTLGQAVDAEIAASKPSATLCWVCGGSGFEYVADELQHQCRKCEGTGTADKSSGEQ
jgi:hypothetical protein